jgi:hypothetical protein
MKYIILNANIKSDTVYLEKCNFFPKKVFISSLFLSNNCLLSKLDVESLYNALYRVAGVRSHMYSKNGITYVNSMTKKVTYSFIVFKGKNIKTIKNNIKNYLLLKDIL